jgi:arginyl-tRNA synthetase
MTQDLGTAVKKITDEKLKRSIYVVGSEQKYHFKCLFTILKAIGYDWADNCQHRSYGMVHLPDGKMKSREGTVVDADNLVADVEILALKGLQERHGGDSTVAKEEMGERAHKIAVAAIKFYLLRVGSDQEIRFNPKESIAFEGFTGPYCQYSYARAMKILRDAGKLSEEVDFSLLGTDEELILAQKINGLTSSVKKAAEELNPSIVALQVFELAKAFSQFYHLNPILKGEISNDLKWARLALVQIFARTIKQGLALLGIETMNEM